MVKPLLGITMGDAAGIGPELIIKALSSERIYDCCRPLVIGSVDVMKFYLDKFDSKLEINPVKDISSGSYSFGSMDILESDEVSINANQIKIGEVDSLLGKAAVIYTQQAGKLAVDKKIDAIVSAPLNKESMRAAGYKFEGQTQILGELTGAKKYSMILILGDMKVMMLSTHLSLREACDKVKKQRVYDMIKLADSSLKELGIKKPKIAVAGLNPHCGEGGIFGTEEVDEVIPAMEEARSEGIDAIGPVPADVVFVKASKGEYDLVLAMYHDQANMAAKLLGFGSVVTLLAGLPIIRTSVGHGTAFDIAGKNIADPNNFIESIIAAAKLASLRMKS